MNFFSKVRLVNLTKLLRDKKYLLPVFSLVFLGIGTLFALLLVKLSADIRQEAAVYPICWGKRDGTNICENSFTRAICVGGLTSNSSKCPAGQVCVDGQCKAKLESGIAAPAPSPAQSSNPSTDGAQPVACDSLGDIPDPGCEGKNVNDSCPGFEGARCLLASYSGVSYCQCATVSIEEEPEPTASPTPAPAEPAPIDPWCRGQLPGNTYQIAKDQCGCLIPGKRNQLCVGNNQFVRSDDRCQVLCASNYNTEPGAQCDELSRPDEYCADKRVGESCDQLGGTCGIRYSLAQPFCFCR